MLQKITPLLLLFLGETLSIGAELVGSKRAAEVGSYASTFFVMLPIVILGGALLVGGYMLGYTQFKNIWIVTALSVGSILIVEPFLAFVLFHQTPTLGAGIGLCLGALGIAATLFL
ncbi:MAG: hypothetical protein NT019_02595 [Candidatus Adlerbacteria bacterium]|nr:hypothetical protein [Candidatus Adlerbacteria bacterium]